MQRQPVHAFENYADFIKGIAIAEIFLVHWKGQWFGWQGVHLFIILSGFGLTYSALKRNRLPDRQQWLRRRLRRLLPAYWIAAIGSLPLFFLMWQLGGASLLRGLTVTLLDLPLLRHAFGDLWGGPTGAFWFIPFIISFYLIFPWIYQRLRACLNAPGGLWRFFGLLIAIEWVYRAFAIYVLDGRPVGYDHPEFFNLLPEAIPPRSLLPEDFAWSFLQGPVAFGLAPSRLVEFGIGMGIAIALIRAPQRFQALLSNVWVVLAGTVLWLAAQGLLVAGRWAWIPADGAIGLGSMVVAVTLARLSLDRCPWGFRAISALGGWSFYVFLTHQPLLRLAGYAADRLPINSVLGDVLALAAGLVATAIATWGLTRFDRAAAVDRVFERLTQPLTGATSK